MRWHFIERGQGRPLVLLHGIGMTHRAWDPVIDLLAQTRRVLAFDIPGFGNTPALPNSALPSCENIAESLNKCLNNLGIAAGEADIAGNSLGGLIALHAGAQGYARSVFGLSPGGLYRQKPPPHIKPTFWLIRSSAKVSPRLLRLMLGNPLGRSLALAVPVSSQSWKMPAAAAIRAAEEFSQSPVFDQTFNAVAPFSCGDQIKVPCTVAFGSRDFILTRAAQRSSMVPRHTRWLRPRGWGHVPMWDDPKGVSNMILDATR